ncbi:hypothetical protein Fmac_026719 [Flemingia macrophylla]|uniref:Uncharacterized protein n=1 Tax=Flemingia macrophylla TaxID=520843 RepID=A0ABD1LHE1_9FABA
MKDEKKICEKSKRKEKNNYEKKKYNKWEGKEKEIGLTLGHFLCLSYYLFPIVPLFSLVLSFHIQILSHPYLGHITT